MISKIFRSSDLPNRHFDVAKILALLQQSICFQQRTGYFVYYVYHYFTQSNSEMSPYILLAWHCNSCSDDNFQR